MRKRSLLQICLLVALEAPSLPALPPGTGPLRCRPLLHALAGGIEESDLVRLIAERGVEFRLTPAERREFLLSGASSALLLAIDTYFQVPFNHPRMASQAPLSVENVIGLLQSGARPAMVAGLAAISGIRFDLTAAMEREIRRSGGDSQLIAALTSPFIANSAPKPPLAALLPVRAASRAARALPA
jgi:hypothetical protein